MDKSKRKAIIAGNWKMNKTPKEAKELLNAITPLVKDAGCEVIACVPYVDLATAPEATEGTNVKIGAENCHWAESGAFTGEISTGMLKEMGVEYVVLGHSERRQYFGETNETVNKNGSFILPQVLNQSFVSANSCWERECDITEEVIARQIKLDLFNVTEEELKNVVIAYEPVWAIGTGKTATADQAEEVCSFIRATIAKLYNQAAADAVTIQYGGSMNDGNADELLSKTNVDGGLIGGAITHSREVCRNRERLQASNLNSIFKHDAVYFGHGTKVCNRLLDFVFCITRLCMLYGKDTQNEKTGNFNDS